MSAPPKHIWIHGFQVDCSDMDFSPHCDHAACQLCGAVFQSNLDRKQQRSFEELQTAHTLRQQWRVSHAKTHSEKEHRQLAASGFMLTPEAAKRLAAYGIIPLSDMVFNPETAAALRESSPTPTSDAETATT